MRYYAFIVFMALLALAEGANAQSFNVTTTGLNTGQCVQANGSTSITPLGCGGRVNQVTISADTTLTNSQCGSVILSDGVAPYKLTLPAAPLKNCAFTFRTLFKDFYLNFDGKQAALPGHEFVTFWTIPIIAAFRTHAPSISFQYDGTYWEQSSFSSSTYQSTILPHNAAQLAHGQVYFQWNSSASQFTLCPSNGPGGLIVDGDMWQIPVNCLAIAQSSTFSSHLNYFYAVHGDGDTISVSNAGDNGSGKIRLQVSDSRGTANDAIWIDCWDIVGAVQANVSDAATVVDSTHIDLVNTSSSGLDPYLSGGTCHVLRLVASETGHSTSANGVEEMTGGDGHYTLVGMCYIGSSNAVNDSATKRDCASYYNRGTKTCINEFTTDHTTTSTTYTELGAEIECEFVTWGTGDPSGKADLSWSISGMMSNDTGSDGVSVTAGFDPAPSSPNPETEQSAAINSSSPVSDFSLAVRGSKTALAEGRHVITLLGKAIAGGTAKIYGTTPATSLEVRIPQ